MILSEDYKLSYDLFLAEQELFTSFNNVFSSITLNESFDYNEYKIICEGIQENVTNYLNKVTTNIQKVYDRFVNSVGNKNQKNYLIKISDKIKEANPKFNINNFPNYDINIFTGYKVKKYDRQTMSDDLKTQKGYLQKYYSSLYSERNNMNVMLQKAVIRGYNNIRCDKTTLIKSYNFCSTVFYDIRKSIEEDIKIINQAVDNITQSLQMVKSTQESNMIYSEFINEAIINTNNQKNGYKMNFVDSDGSKSNPGDKSSQVQNNLINQISNYMKISTQLISAKMKVLTKMYKSNLDIVKHYADTIQFGNPNNAKSGAQKVQINNNK